MQEESAAGEVALEPAVPHPRGPVRPEASGDPSRWPGWHRGPRTWGVPEASRTVVRSALSCGRGGLGGTPARPVDYLRPRGSPNLETAEPGSTKFWSDWDDGLSITGGGDLVLWDPGGGARGLPAIESASKKKKRLGFLRKN